MMRSARVQSGWIINLFSLVARSRPLSVNRARRLRRNSASKNQAGCYWLGAREIFLQLLEPLPSAVQFKESVSRTTDIVHVFATQNEDLKKQVTSFRKQLRSNAMVWVSWPKKAAKVLTDITEDTIRQMALPLGFVDIKVCAISEVWSGLKLVIRKELR